MHSAFWALKRKVFASALSKRCFVWDAAWNVSFPSRSPLTYEIALFFLNLTMPPSLPYNVESNRMEM